VGTIDSLWEANMDMLSPDTGLNLHDPNWRIYAHGSAPAPKYIAPEAQIRHSMIAEGGEVCGDITNSVLFDNVHVAKGAQVRYSILMPGVTVEEDAVVEFAILAENTRVGAGARVGNVKEIDAEGKKITVSAAGVSIAPGCVISAGTLIGEDVAAQRGGADK